jgi:hypothetical protein
MQSASRGEKRRLFEATPLLLCPSRSPGAHTWLTHLLLPASKAATDQARKTKTNECMVIFFSLLFLTHQGFDQVADPKCMLKSAYY